MGKLLKFYLSIFTVLLFFSCKENTLEAKKGNNRELAEQVYKTGENLLQGSPESMERIKEAIALDTTYAEAIRELSVAYLKRGMPHKWKPIFDEAVEKDAATWQPWRGYLYLWFYRDYKKAIADFDASDTLTDYIDHPQGHSVDFWRGIAYLGLKDYENSIAYWDKHITKETEDSGEDWVELEAFLYRGIAYYESGNPEKAVENFDKVIQYFKQSADAKYYKALILKDDDAIEAKALIEDAIIDFNAGFYNNRDYVETLRQIYMEDLEDVKESILE
ncbi:tetratricopeptide repeat protein [Maribacter sp. 2308TA10-17]|uniref:tetratricopeptide repeat protein n=1 Tax=Maribacter sp. 2308TA10-17 TaxID=3386276 RepID=UPI0039BC8201